MSEFDVGIVIVNYRLADLVVAAIEALRRDLEPSGLRGDVIIVDNGSTPAERTVLQRLGVKYVYPGKNLGYAGGINLGITYLDTDVLVVMNPDVLVLPGCLLTLIAALNQGAAVAGPLFFWDRSLEFMLPPTETRTRRHELLRQLSNRNNDWLIRARGVWRRHARSHWNADQPITSAALSGALLAFTRAVWDKVGPFDEGYLLYFEENDWLMRVEGSGLRPVFVPGARAIHLYNQSASQVGISRRWYAESFERFGNQYYGQRFMTQYRQLERRHQQRAVPSTGARIWLPGWPEITLPDEAHAHYPLWLEISDTSKEYPAATSKITDSSAGTWRLPYEVWHYIPPGIYYLQLTDNTGQELNRYVFRRALSVRARVAKAAPAPRRTTPADAARRERIVIFGQYKTGTTALYSKIKHSLSGDVRSLFEAERFIPEPGDEARHLLAKIMIGSPPPADHDSFMGFNHKIYLVRDPRDWIISGLLFIPQQLATIYRNEVVLERVLCLFRQKEIDPLSLSVLDLLEVVYGYAHRQSLSSVRDWLVAQHDWLRLFENRQEDAFTLRYEDFVDDRLGDLEAYLDRPLQGDVKIEASVDHVIRTKSYGNWRHWLLPEDVAFFRPLVQHYLIRHGYGDDWELNRAPVIAPEHASGYVERTVKKRLAAENGAEAAGA